MQVERKEIGRNGYTSGHEFSTAQYKRPALLFCWSVLIHAIRVWSVIIPKRPHIFLCRQARKNDPMTIYVFFHSAFSFASFCLFSVLWWRTCSHIRKKWLFSLEKITIKSPIPALTPSSRTSFLLSSWRDENAYLFHVSISWGKDYALWWSKSSKKEMERFRHFFLVFHSPLFFKEKLARSSQRHMVHNEKEFYYVQLGFLWISLLFPSFTILPSWKKDDEVTCNWISQAAYVHAGHLRGNHCISASWENHMNKKYWLSLCSPHNHYTNIFFIAWFDEYRWRYLNEHLRGHFTVWDAFLKPLLSLFSVHNGEKKN